MSKLILKDINTLIETEIFSAGKSCSFQLRSNCDDFSSWDSPRKFKTLNKLSISSECKDNKSTFIFQSTVHPHYKSQQQAHGPKCLQKQRWNKWQSSHTIMDTPWHHVFRHLTFYDQCADVQMKPAAEEELRDSWCELYLWMCSRDESQEQFDGNI